MKEHKFTYEWNLSTGYKESNGLKVFSCFSCGGGSTMGYKLAGFTVIGNNEIDPKMNKCYVENHHPKYNFLEPIQTFKLRNDFPEELYHLDILDGSPPCSSFSLAGSREKDWGKEKVFKEGQEKQVLDTLFFDFIDLAKKLQPKVIIAENVKGLLMGSAREYLAKIGNAFLDAGYLFNYKLLNASTMGVPQRRERVFFYAIRNDLAKHIDFEDMFQTMPYLDLEFNEQEITYSEIREEDGNKEAYGLTEYFSSLWKKCKPGASFSSVHLKGSCFNEIKLEPNRALPTIRAAGSPYDYEVERRLFTDEFIKGGTFPLDYNFLDQKPNYLIGMSVPPVMMAQIALRIYEQWFSKIPTLKKVD